MQLASVPKLLTCSVRADGCECVKDTGRIGRDSLFIQSERLSRKRLVGTRFKRFLLQYLYFEGHSAWSTQSALMLEARHEPANA